MSVRCQTCSKSIKEIYSSIGKCRCGNTYCPKHIQMHDCTFDYNNMFKKNNTMVKCESIKVDKI